MQNLNFFQKIQFWWKNEFEFSRQKCDYWELDYLNKIWDFATVCHTSWILISLGSLAKGERKGINLSAIDNDGMVLSFTGVAAPESWGFFGK